MTHKIETIIEKLNKIEKPVTNKYIVFREQHLKDPNCIKLTKELERLKYKIKINGIIGKIGNTSMLRRISRNEVPIEDFMKEILKP